jgi:hypothetical protein
MTGRCVVTDCHDGPDLDGEPGPRMAKIGLTCSRCHNRLERVLAELPATLTNLRAVLGGTTGGRAENRRTKGSPPLPLNVCVHDHLEHTHTLLVSWTRLVAEERSLRGPDHPNPAWLLGQLSWIVDQPWVDDFDDEIREASRVAEALARSRPGWNQLSAPCPGCGGMTLGRWDGDDHVGCPCGERWPERDYPRMVLVLATDPKRTLTAEEAAARAEVKPATFRQWVSRGHVRRAGTANGEARYRTEDVDAMMKRDGEGAA